MPSEQMQPKHVADLVSRRAKRLGNDHPPWAAKSVNMVVLFAIIRERPWPNRAPTPGNVFENVVSFWSCWSGHIESLTDVACFRD